MNRFFNSFSRAPASLDVDVDDIDTDDEGGGDDDLNIGWGGGAESADGRPLTEADVDPNALPVDTSSADEDEDDASASGVGGDDDGAAADAEDIDGDFFDAAEDWDDEEEDESPKSEDDAGDEEEDERVEAEAAAESSGTTGQPKQKRKKTTSVARHATMEIPAGGSIKYFSVDVETSGSSRVRHGVVKLACVALDDDFQILDTFEELIYQDGPFAAAAKRVHKITEKMVANASSFGIVAGRFNDWMTNLLEPLDVGVLVAHNGDACDYQWLCAGYQKSGVSWPAEVTHTIDTKHILATRYRADFGYHLLSEDEWEQRTPKGNTSYSCSGCTDYLLRRPERIKLHGVYRGNEIEFGNGNLRFNDVCGMAHDPLADALGSAIIISDSKGILFLQKQSRPVTVPMSYHWEAMVKKLAEPVIIHEPVPSPWEEHGDGEEPPVVVDAMDYRPPGGLAPGPSAELKDHVIRCLHTAAESAALDAICSTDSAAADLAFIIWTFFFTKALLLHVSACTNAYATQPWVVMYQQDSRRVQYQGPPRNDGDHVLQRQKCKNWKHLSIAELGIFSGIVIKMGAVNHKTLEQYWNHDGRDGYGCRIISSTMRKKRFEEIYANLSFLMPGSTQYLGDRLRKIRYVNDYLLSRVQAAWNPEQDAAIDESMIPTCTKYCPFRQTMKSKPIKCGIKVFCLVFCASTYLYNWDVFLGKGSTDDAGAFVHTLICSRLLLQSFNHTNMRIFMDNFFTSVSLFRVLLGRGIFCVGPTKAARPTKVGSRGMNSWPFQGYDKGDSWKVGGKGWMRHAVQKVGVGGAILATVWLDNRFLSMLSTVYIVKSEEGQTVLRWTREKMKRLPVRAPVAVIFYQKMMGAVDRLDKVVALANIRIRRCKKRYHRAIFFWYVSTIGFNNVKVIFERLVGEEQVKALRKRHQRFGYFHWFQDELADTIISKFLSQAAAEVAQYGQLDEAARKVKEEEGFCTALHFAPKSSRELAPSTPVAETTVDHNWVSISDIKVMRKGVEASLPRGNCEVCKQSAKVAIEGASKIYRMPGGQRCPMPRHGCNQCKVRLCKDCFDKYDHKRNQTPTCVAVSLFSLPAAVAVSPDTPVVQPDFYLAT